MGAKVTASDVGRGAIDFAQGVLYRVRRQSQVAAEGERVGWLIMTGFAGARGSRAVGGWADRMLRCGGVWSDMQATPLTTGD